MPVSMPVFQRFPVEAEIIGRLVVGYGELELDLFNCVVMGISDFDKTAKTMFKHRSETKRIKIAETFGREPYADLDLSGWFDEAIIGMRYCVQVRNQYAHRNFYDDISGTLAFVNLEELAKRDEIVNDLISLTVMYVTPILLEAQERYFMYVRATIGFLNYEGRVRSGKITVNPFGPHEKLTQPPLFLPGDTITTSLGL